MLPKMSDEKPSTTPMTFITTQDEVSHPAVVAKPLPEAASGSPYRKYAVIAVTGIAVVAIVLVGMYFFTAAQKEILKFSYNRDGNTKEDVTSDPNTNIVQYHVYNADYEMWVVDDFNRDIQVMKIHSDSGTNCYVAPLNRTTATDPSKVSKPSDPDKMKSNTTYTVTYQSASTTIRDSTFLSKAAKDTCKGISTYWVYPRCEAPKFSTDKVPRQKRKTTCTPCCCTYCYLPMCFVVCLC